MPGTVQAPAGSRPRRRRRLRVLVLLLAAGCTPDPCESGFLYLPSGEAFDSMRQAIRFAGAEGVVHVCPGTHELAEGILINKANTSGLMVQGDSGGRSVIRLVGEQALVGGTVDAPLEVRDLTFEGSEAVGRDYVDDRIVTETGFEYEYYDPFGSSELRDGGPEIGGQVTFLRVTSRENAGIWGGGAEVTADASGEVVFEDCTFENNRATHGSRGGALAVLTDAGRFREYEAKVGSTIVSINTDWGSGDDDNLGGDELVPDDIAFLHTDSDVTMGEVIVDATYNFDGVASFTCDVATAVCE